MRAMRPSFLSVLLALAACAGEPWTADGAVVSRVVEVKARGLDVVPVTLVAPGNGQGPRLEKQSGLVLLPGGLVEADRYLWLAKALARRGVVVALPRFPLDLGFFAIDNAHVARRLLVEGDEASGTPALVAAGKVAIAGHSLGGVVAASAAVDGGYADLVLFASYAAGGDPVETLTIPVLSVAGGSDCKALRETVRAGIDRFSSATALFAEIPGLTHYGFTDSLREDLDAACVSGLDLEAGHALITELVHAHLKAHLERDAASRQRLEQGWRGIVLEGAR